ncbi:MAG TPA: DUF3034 family protein, partial [Steroidobacteraceae bacterium]|nr:DUF3034 family protein [Steroidobacteraceae bacterium]
TAADAPAAPQTNSSSAGTDLPMPPPPVGFLAIDQGKLPLTAGFNDVEGAGGAGLVPIALVTGYGTRNSWGANAHYTNVDLNSFQLHAYGVAVGALDRFELSYTKHDFEVTGGPLDGLGVEQSIVGLKVKLFGDAVYFQDSWVPQVAVGAQYKQNDGIKDGASVGLAGLVSPKALGAKDDDGTDFYLSATKIFLGQSFVVNATLRYTKANQFGLLGFGGDRDDGYSLEPEAVVAYLFTRKLAGGVEYRSKPHNLSVDTEDDAWDAFLAWTPTRNISLVAAYVNLGSILGPVTGDTDDQKGAYLSFQVGF